MGTCHKSNVNLLMWLCDTSCRQHISPGECRSPTAVTGQGFSPELWTSPRQTSHPSLQMEVPPCFPWVSLLGVDGCHL